jgi:hypothetical protein
MSDRIKKDLAVKQREAERTVQRAGKRKAATEYEEAQEAFWGNHERLKAEAAKSRISRTG